jgi:hypothetical protein
MLQGSWWSMGDNECDGWKLGTHPNHAILGIGDPEYSNNFVHIEGARVHYYNNVIYVEIFVLVMFVYLGVYHNTLVTAACVLVRVSREYCGLAHHCSPLMSKC